MREDRNFMLLNDLKVHKILEKYFPQIKLFCFLFTNVIETMKRLTDDIFFIFPTYCDIFENLILK